MVGDAASCSIVNSSGNGGAGIAVNVTLAGVDSLSAGSCANFALGVAALSRRGNITIFGCRATWTDPRKNLGRGDAFEFSCIWPICQLSRLFHKEFTDRFEVTIGNSHERGHAHQN